MDVAITPSYDPDFYAALAAGVRRSADRVAAVIVEQLRPRSVVDVGCGTGLWLAALRARGMTDVLGLDGPWVPREQLAIPENCFRAVDLSAPFRLERRFDLALCLEMAEHLSPPAAGGLVRSLVELAPLVVFSAAIPGQGGHGHLNEQWPGYWAALFQAAGYHCSTVLRAMHWHDPAIEVWYRQNLLCFVASGQVSRYPFLFDAPATTAPLDIVHPELFSRVCSDLAGQTAYAQHLEKELSLARAELERARERSDGADREL